MERKIETDTSERTGKIKSAIVLTVVSGFLATGWLAQSNSASALNGSAATGLFGGIGIPAFIDSSTSEPAPLPALPPGPRAYVINSASNTVSIVDTNTHVVVGT